MDILRTSKKKAEPAARNGIAEWAVTILILLFGTTTVLQAFVVPTGSMENTVLIGDHLFVDKLAYAPAGKFTGKLLPYSEPKRGDIIVFRYPVDIRATYVKRVIGIPGDRVRIVNKRVIVNGKELVEPYKVLLPERRSNYLDNFPQQPDLMLLPRVEGMLRDHISGGELVVPAGQFFAMGDNRDNSSDSRFWGLVPRENIIGKPLLVFWSYDAPTEHIADGNINVDHLIDMAQHFFTKTRWNRTFLFIAPTHLAKLGRGKE